MRKKRVVIFVNDAILMKDQSFRVCTAIGRVTDGMSKMLVGRSLQICSAKSAPLIGIGLTYLIKFAGDQSTHPFTFQGLCTINITVWRF